MKITTVFVGILILILAIGFVGGRLYEQKQVESNLYPKTGHILYVDHKANLLLIEDPLGHHWLYEGTKDWVEGDLCSMIMNNNGTDGIKDDEIVMLCYEWCP